MHTAEDASPGTPAFIWLGLNAGGADATPASGVPKAGTLLTRAGLCIYLHLLLDLKVAGGTLSEPD